MSAAPLDPTPILETAFAFFGSRTLLAAAELGLFTRLGDEALTAGELGGALELHERGTYDFFDALVAMRFLDRDGDGPSARYRNTPATRQFLVRTSPAYLGGILEMASARLYPFWADLPEGLRTGRPQNEVKRTGRAVFEELYADPAKLEQFLAAMAGISRGNFAALAQKFDFSSYRTLCDVGGAAGILSIEVAKAHPHMACTSFDLPVVAPIAARTVDAAGLSGRIEVASGDFFSGPLPKADVITMGMILHDWNLEKKKHLVKAAYDALPPGGAFVAVEHLIDDARRENAFGLWMSLNMLIEFGDQAFDFTGADFDGWAREAGFARTEVLHLAGPCSAGIAYKA